MDKYCGNCGHPLSDFAKFCANCGQPVNTKNEKQNMAAESKIESVEENETPSSKKEPVKENANENSQKGDVKQKESGNSQNGNAKQKEGGFIATLVNEFPRFTQLLRSYSFSGASFISHSFRTTSQTTPIPIFSI